MGQRMSWNEMKRVYPNEWIAVVHYTSNEFGDIDGEVVGHSKDKDAFYHDLKGLVQQYGDVAMEYTGDRVKNPDVPLLWQISSTE